MARRKPGDDINFLLDVRNYNLYGWLHHRYETRSGRIGAETYIYVFDHLSLIYWKLFTIIHYGLLSFFLYKYYELFRTHNSDGKNYFMLALCMALPFGMDLGAFIDANFWVTGAMNYLWVAAAGIVSFYPVLYLSLRNRLTHWVYWVISIPLVFVAATSQEQVGALIVGFSIVFTGAYVVAKKKIHPFLAVYTSLAFVGFLLDYLAPGTHIRVVTATATRIPDFFTAPITSRIEWSYRWFLDATINHFGVLLVLIWLLSAFLLYKRYKKQPLALFAVTTFILASLFHLAKGGLNLLFNFYASWGIKSFPKPSYIAVIFWTFMLVQTVVAAYFIFKQKQRSIILALLIAAAFASTAIVTFSPTLYGSGGRTTFVPAILLCLVILLLTDAVIKKFKESMVALGMLLLYVPVFNYVTIYVIFTTHFRIHLPW